MSHPSEGVVKQELYRKDPLLVLHEKFMLVEGRVQNRDHVVHVQAEKLWPLSGGLRCEELEPIGVAVEFR